MDTSFSALMGLARDSVTDPRLGARRIMAADLPLGARWQAFVLVVLVSVLFGQVTARMLNTAAMMGSVTASPILSVVVQGFALLAMVYAAHHVGRAMGGHGRFGDALLLVSWLQAIMVLVQVAQLFVALLLPPLAAIVGILSVLLFLWLLTNFIAELHGFTSLGRVFGMVVLTGLGLAFMLAILLAMLGVTPPEVG